VNASMSGSEHPPLHTVTLPQQWPKCCAASSIRNWTARQWVQFSCKHGPHPSSPVQLPSGC
jgi:hypothetical protein